MNKLTIFALLLCFAFVCGCGPKRPDNFPTLYGCVLTFVFSDGAPVDGASVALVSDNPEHAQWSISGLTNASGVAVIRTHGDFSGAPAGTFRILLRKAESVATGEVDHEGEPIYEARHLVGAVYGDPRNTPLSVTVENRAVAETFTIER